MRSVIMLFPSLIGVFTNKSFTQLRKKYNDFVLFTIDCLLLKYMSEKRKQITEAALKLFCEYGFQHTSTARISKEAGVATGTLFLYFSSKDELINKLYKEAKQQLVEVLQKDLPSDATAEVQLRHIWIKANEWALGNIDAFRFIHMFSASPLITTLTKEEIAPSSKFAEDFIKKAIQQGEITQIDIRFFLLLFDSFWTATVNHLANNDLTNKNQVILESFHIFWKGISH